MGIFSFGKKDDAPSRRGATPASTRGARSERVERRTRRTERSADADATLLDPTLPEKQRARRRLVGAIALVVGAVVILPMVLDSHPKPVTDDISIEIPSRPVPKAAVSHEDTQAGVAPDNPAPGAAAAASGLAPVPSTNAAAQKQAAGGQAGAEPGADSEGAAPGNAAAPSARTGKAPAPVAAVNTAPAKPAKPAKATPAPAVQTEANAAGADADSGTPASPPGNRFAVQLGSFPDEASARNWATRLKAAGVPAYTERRKQTDGSTRILLRAGPFADRAAASAAIAKVRAAGLTASANNGAAQQ